VRVRDLIEVPELRLRLVAGRNGLDRVIRHVYTTDLPDPSRYVAQGELVLTGLVWCRGPSDAERFVDALARSGAVALGAGEALGPVPATVVEACVRHGMTLLAVPAETSFGAVTDEVALRLNDTAAGLRRRLAEEIVAQVSEGGGEVASLLRTAGLPPDGRYLMVAFRGVSCELAEELLTAYGGQAVVASHGDEIVGFMLKDGQAQSLPEWLRATPLLSGLRVTVGVSAPADGCGALAGALREASSARRLAALRASSGTDPGPVAVATSAEADSYELLLASVAAPVLRTFRDRLLGPVADYDERHHAELLPTLRAFLDCDGSWNTCAFRLYVHVNTVRYRIGRIEELTGRNLSSLSDRVDFFLALRSIPLVNVVNAPGAQHAEVRE
jgi:purine catabolism regulatory family protein/PucR-like helix-turn-helix protein/diguanylate cyclase with GGDEF domain